MTLPFRLLFFIEQLIPALVKPGSQTVLQLYTSACTSGHMPYIPMTNPDLELGGGGGGLLALPAFLPSAQVFFLPKNVLGQLGDQSITVLSCCS